MDGNLFDPMPENLDQEWAETLVESKQVRIERIVSVGQATPEGFWYDQAEHEWVVVLKGEATLRLEDDDVPVRLSPGDHIQIPSHRKHRVQSTLASEPTVWLAVFYRER